MRGHDCKKIKFLKPHCFCAGSVTRIDPIPAWAGRELLQTLDGQETLGQRHFCIQTSKGRLEFEARTDNECTMFIEGIGRLLAYASTLKPHVSSPQH